jgi:hypothetical protein
MNRPFAAISDHRGRYVVEAMLHGAAFALEDSKVVSRNGSSGPKPATIVFFDSPGSEQAVDIARIHPGLNYGVTVEVREWTSPRELAAAETR